MTLVGNLRTAVVGVTALTCLSCEGAQTDERSAQPDELVSDFPHLSDETYVGVLTCSYVPQGDIERFLATSALTSADVALPEGIEFTEIVATSAAGWAYEPVAIVGQPENLPYDDLLISNSNPPYEYEILDLPFKPGRVLDFALGVIVDVPANSDSNPPAAITITGARFEVDGASYLWKWEREAFVSRLSLDDPEGCTRTKEPGTILDE